MKNILWCAFALCLVGGIAGAQTPKGIKGIRGKDAMTPLIFATPPKKLIEYGWDKPTPAFLRDHLKEMETKPFDGVGVGLPAEAGEGNIFLVDKWPAITEAAKREQIDILQSLPTPTTFTDNFLMIHAASSLDWFDEMQWKRAEDHLRFLARAARAGHFKGVFWDAESYGGINPWDYRKQTEKEKRSFAEFAAQVRKRGKRFIEVLQDEYPGLTVLSMRQLSDFQDGSPFSAKLLPVRDPKAAEATLPEQWWGLHIAFTNGILDGLKPDTTFIDANEDAYYYTSPTDFFRFSHTMRQEALALVAPENRAKYLAQYRLGQAVSVDFTLGEWSGPKGLSFPPFLRDQALELSEADRLRWFGQNLYYALTTSDEYVWCYNEDRNWWTGKNIPAGLDETIRDVRRKFGANEPLGYNMEASLAAAREAIKKR